MKYTKILKMLLVLALSTSITSCDIFDDPVEETDPVTPASISYLDPEYNKYWSPTPDDNTVTYLVTNTGDGVVTYAVQDGSNTCGAIVDPETGKVTFTKAGKATIIATTSSTNTYTYEGDDATASYTLTIHKIDGSISFATSEVNKTNTDKAFTNTLTNTGDGKVTYTSSDTSVARLALCAYYLKKSFIACKYVAMR